VSTKKVTEGSISALMSYKSVLTIMHPLRLSISTLHFVYIFESEQDGTYWENTCDVDRQPQAAKKSNEITIFQSLSLSRITKVKSS